MSVHAFLHRSAELPGRGRLAACRAGDAVFAAARRAVSTAPLPWPHEGQASVEVEGVGSLGTVGEQRPVPIASITKVMTAHVVLREHPLGPRDSGPMVRVDRAAAREAGSTIESVVPVEEGQEFSLRQLLAYMLIPSGNNIARLLARWTAGSETAFVRRMNAAAADLGMHRTRFTGSCGMDIGNTSTAGDLLVLARTVMRDEVFRTIVATPSVRLPGDRGEARTTNRLLGRHGVVGLKTGTSTPAGGNVLWAAYTDVGGTRRLVLGVVLAQRTGCSPVRARAAVWAHSRRLVEAVRRDPLRLAAAERGRRSEGADPAEEAAMSEHGRAEKVRPHDPRGRAPQDHRPQDRRAELLPDDGAMVDEHGRPPGVPSRTGTGSSAPPADPERVERAAAHGAEPGTPGR